MNTVSYSLAANRPRAASSVCEQEPKPFLRRLDTFDCNSKDTTAYSSNVTVNNPAAASSLQPTPAVAGAGKKPPRTPWRNTEMTVETRDFLRSSPKRELQLVPKQQSAQLSALTTRPASVDGGRYAKTPEKKRKLEIDTSNLNASTQGEPSRAVLFVKNREAECKHELAQSVIELISQNEKSLAESDSRLNAYLNRSLNAVPADCLAVVEGLKKQWVQRIRNLSKIFELIDARRTASLPQDLLEAVYHTPKSVSKTLEGLTF